MIKTILPAWQIEESLTLPTLLASILWANKTQEDVQYFRIDYDSHSQQFALLFLPAHINRRQRTAVFFTPGSWRNSNPEIYRFIGYFSAK